MAVQYDINWLMERFEHNDVLKYIFFWGHAHNNADAVGKFCFSQWYESPFTVNDVTYKTAEHWMMAYKARLFDNDDIFNKIIECRKPAEAKELGRRVIGYDDQTWNEKRYEIVKLGNIHKFNQHPQLADYLLKTDGRVLVEASPVDTIWGIGLSHDDRDVENIYAWRGQNLLGFALMEARDFLKDFGLFKPLAGAMQPPWLKFPEVDSADMFWQMGKGEEYMQAFSKYYDALSEREQTIYKLSNPTFSGWDSFYD